MPTVEHYLTGISIGVGALVALNVAMVAVGIGFAQTLGEHTEAIAGVRQEIPTVVERLGVRFDQINQRFDQLTAEVAGVRAAMTASELDMSKVSRRHGDRQGR